MNSPRLSLLTLAAAALLGLPAAHADVRLPSLISDNMVLQQEVPANVWGWADPQEKVTVKLGANTATAIAGVDGKWSAKLTGLAPGVAGDMTIAGKNTLTIKNVAVGEVWVCSGQSNMEFVVQGAKDAQAEIKTADRPDIRMFTVARTYKLEPQEDCAGKWEVCTPETVGHFSAVGYFFGRRLADDLKWPIGLIHSSVGGTPAQAWTPTEVLAADPDFQQFLQAWENAKANYPKAKAAYDVALEKWKADAEAAKTAGTAAPKPPAVPRGGDANGSPGGLYNGMIAPLIPYTIRGAIWYQGEANAGNGKLYRKLFPAMIESWREKWGIPEFPFLFVQLANYMAKTEQPVESNWAELRDAQLATLELKNTGMAVAIDIGEGDNIHPKNKQEVGRRLAVNALAMVYYREVEYASPRPLDAQIEDNKLRITLRNAEGMKTTDGAAPKGFAIAGEDHKFHWATAELAGDHIILSSPEVPKPIAVRYAWANNPDVNLVNGAGLPVSPFRSDDWPPQPPAAK